MVLLKKNHKIKIPGIRTLIRIIAFIFFVSFIVRCSPQVANKTLRFFFDGVPVKDTLVQVQSVDTTSSFDSDSLTVNRIDPHKATNYYHVPYKEKQCDVCHDGQSMGKMLEPQPELCYQCHESFNDVYKVVHGPVAGGYCTACHSPHFAKDSTLLIRTGQDLCLYCHKPGEGYDTELHDGIEDTSCTECHNPHGGDTRNFLR